MKTRLRHYRAQPLYRHWRALALVLALLLALLTLIHTFRVDALLRHVINTFILHERYAGSTLYLDQYRVSIEARKITGIDDDLSGLTYNTETNTLFSVLNGQPLIVELDLEGRLLRKIEVRGVKDMEGISHVEGNRYVIADEQDQRLLLLEISADSGVIDVTGAPQLSLGITSNGSNKDFEGVSWDDKNRRLLVVKERNPLSIFEITGFVDGDGQQPNLNVSSITPHKFSNIKLRDFSSITYHDESGHLILLSDESRMAVEYDFEGRAVSALALWRGFNGLQKNVPQAEGIAIGPDNSVYIVSEPNLFYVFKPAD